MCWRSAALTTHNVAEHPSEKHTQRSYVNDLIYGKNDATT